MKNNVYVVYDSVGLRYGQMYAFPTDGFAQLELRPMLLGRDNNVSNLKRYEICRVGEIDIETGVLTPCSPVRLSWSSTPVLETESKEEPVTLPLGNAKS